MMPVPGACASCRPMGKAGHVAKKRSSKLTLQSNLQPQHAYHCQKALQRNVAAKQPSTK